MTVAPDLVAQILRLYTVEKWRVGTIARQLHVHRDVVRRVIGGNGAVYPSPLRPCRIDPYRPFMLETLTKFPTLTSSRLLQMLIERGYVGSASHLRHHVANMQIGRARRPLMAFVMVMSYSRRIFLRFFLDAHGATFIRGHVEAFAAFGGCARVVPYDNLKSVVMERRGDAIRFNPVF